MNTTKCGIITIVGPTNAGKSTLINSLVNNKISIVTHKVQTTRYTIRGIVNYNNTQLIFVDTPGIFSPKSHIEKLMVNTALGACYNTETTMVVLDSAKGITNNIRKIIKKISSPAIALLNKVDLVNKVDLLSLSENVNKLFTFERIFMISALKNNGVEDIKKYLAQISPEGPWMYPEEQISDAPLQFILSEITREKVMLRVHQEIPYQIIVETEKIDENEDEIQISQILYVVSQNHKKIVIGKNGGTLRHIIIRSTISMSKKLQKKIVLNVFIKVRKDWVNDQYVLSNIGY